MSRSAKRKLDFRDYDQQPYVKKWVAYNKHWTPQKRLAEEAQQRSKIRKIAEKITISPARYERLAPPRHVVPADAHTRPSQFQWRVLNNRPRVRTVREPVQTTPTAKEPVLLLTNYPHNIVTPDNQQQQSTHNSVSQQNKMARKGYQTGRKGYGASKEETELGRKYLKVYHDPFSNASLTPRIPDGKAIGSQGFKFQLRKPFKLGGFPTGEDANATSGSNNWVVLQPSAAIPCFTVSQTTPVRANVDIIGNSQLITYTRTSNANNPGNWEFSNDTKDNAIHKWRVVSYGLHISLLNNTDSNDGWWEACRISTPTNDEKFRYVVDDGKTLTNGSMGTVPVGIYFPTEQDLTNLPSYTTGRLRDIHHVTFSLHPEGNEHDFRTVESRFFTNNALLADNAYGTPYSGGLAEGIENDSGLWFVNPNLDVDFNDAKAELIRSGLLDDTWDTIIVRLHGRPSGDSNVLIHVVQNIEVIYNEQAINAKFHERSPKYGDMEKESSKRRKKTESAEMIK